MSVRNVYRGTRQKTASEINSISSTAPKKWSSKTLYFIFLILILISSTLSLLFVHAKVTPELFHYFVPCFCVKALRRYMDPELSSVVSQELPVFYINLSEDHERRITVKNQLKRLGFTDVTRVEAWTSVDARERLTAEVTSVPNMLRHNDNEIACIASHLWAMYLAVNDSLNSFPYAMIIEDDVRFEFDLNWNELIERAPKDFTILQLSTSNLEKQTSLWKDFKEKTLKTVPSSDAKLLKQLRNQGMLLSLNTSEKLSDQLWSRRYFDSNLWSTHGYIINKQKIKSLIDQFVHYNSYRSTFEITLKPYAPIPCSRRPCMMPFRIVADIYLYAIFQPAYISMIPLLNGVSSSESIENITNFHDFSSIQEVDKIKHHLQSFQEIHNIVLEIKKSYSFLLPQFFFDSLYTAATTRKTSSSFQKHQQLTRSSMDFLSTTTVMHRRHLRHRNEDPDLQAYENLKNTTQV
jgi:GR25 family glycosyltransferase involved in LPS biosynthesis